MGAEQTLIKASSGQTQRSLILQGSYDLVLLAELALALPALLLLPIPLLQVPLGLVAALLAPGYALAAAIFPARDDLDTPVRAALSFGLSVAVVPVLALSLDALPWGIRPWPIAISLALWILLFCGIAAIRRRALAPSCQAYAPPAFDPPGWWSGLSHRAKLRSAAGALALAAALAATAMPLVIPDSQAYLTEFYALGKQGLAEDYPRQVTAGEASTVTIGIVNKERDERAYRVEVWAIDARDVQRRVLAAQEGPVTLSAGQKREWPVTWRMPWAGDDQQVEILLFIGDSQQPYRRLRLWLNVVERPAANSYSSSQ